MKVLLMTVSSELEMMQKEELLILTSSLYQVDKQKWKELETLVNKYQNDFIKKIRMNYAFLSEDDIHIILLLRIGLSHTQISDIMNILKSSFRIRRGRLKKKMGVECDSISEYIKNLSFD